MGGAGILAGRIPGEARQYHPNPALNLSERGHHGEDRPEHCSTMPEASELAALPAALRPLQDKARHVPGGRLVHRRPAVSPTAVRDELKKILMRREGKVIPIRSRPLRGST